MNQECVAVFISSATKPIANVKLVFSNNKPTIVNAIQLIRDKLPESYSRAFSLSLSNNQSEYNLATVSSIEWLGSDMDAAIFKNNFPLDKLIYRTGDAYLIYKDGKQQKI